MQKLKNTQAKKKNFFEFIQKNEEVQQQLRAPLFEIKLLTSCLNYQLFQRKRLLRMHYKKQLKVKIKSFDEARMVLENEK